MGEDHANGVFMTFMNRGILLCWDQSICFAIFDLDQLGSLGEKDLVFLLGLDECLFEKVGICIYQL